MAAGGEAPPPSTDSGGDSNALTAQRQTRWAGQEYADMTKLRELSAQHAHFAARAEARAAHLMLKVDKLRHVATGLREKSVLARSDVPTLEEGIAQLNAQIGDAAKHARPGVPPTSDVTKLQIQARKLQQKVADKQRRGASLELRAARNTQKASEIKVRADKFLELAREHEQESQVYRQRADQLQMAADGRLGPTPEARGVPPPSYPPQ